MLNFKRKIISSDEYLTAVIAYIHLNPVHHGFTKTCESWHWSSYNTILSKNPTDLKRDEVLQWFGNREEFIKFHDARLNGIPL